MTVNEKICNVLSVFDDPIRFGYYSGDKKRYYIFNYRTTGTDFADDNPNHEKYIVDLHLFAPLNWNSIDRVKQTKIALYSINSTWAIVTNSSDQEGQHIVFEFEMIEGVECG